MCVWIHIHVCVFSKYICVYILICIYTHTHSQSHTKYVIIYVRHEHTQKHTELHKYALSFTLSHTHNHARTHAHAHTHKHTNTSTHTRSYAHAHTLADTFIYAHTHCFLISHSHILIPPPSLKHHCFLIRSLPFCLFPLAQFSNFNVFPTVLSCAQSPGVLRGNYGITAPSAASLLSGDHHTVPTATRVPPPCCHSVMRPCGHAALLPCGHAAMLPYRSPPALSVLAFRQLLQPWWPQHYAFPSPLLCAMPGLSSSMTL